MDDKETWHKLLMYGSWEKATTLEYLCRPSIKTFYFFKIKKVEEYWKHFKKLKIRSQKDRQIHEECLICWFICQMPKMTGTEWTEARSWFLNPGFTCGLPKLNSLKYHCFPKRFALKATKVRSQRWLWCGKQAHLALS